ncbi:Arc family DNA-binding protein, partial [Pseudomonas aeruginosa]
MTMARETEDKFVVRMPLGLRDQLKQKAAQAAQGPNWRMTMARETEDKFVVRMPLGLRDQLKQKAADNHRSANSEIVYRLERSNALE